MITQFLAAIGLTLSAPGLLSLLTGSGRRGVPGRPLPRTYDWAFRQNCQGIPIEYCRALTKRESNFDPNDQQGPAWGLMQVVEVLRKSYNDRHGTHYDRVDLLDVHTNTKIACYLLRQIATSYVKRYPAAFPGGVDWHDLRFVDLVTFGWNAGWSAAAGTSYAIGKLLERGFQPWEITIDTVHAYADIDPRVASTLRSDAKVAWCKTVGDYYVRELAFAGKTIT